MASTSIGRKEVSFIYVDHTINSARGQDEEDVGGIFPKWFFHLFMSLFFWLMYHMKTESQEDDETLFKYINFLIW